MTRVPLLCRIGFITGAIATRDDLGSTTGLLAENPLIESIGDVNPTLRIGRHTARQSHQARILRTTGCERRADCGGNESVRSHGSNARIERIGDENIA